MTTRLYFLVADEPSAEKITQAVGAQNIKEENIYAVAKEDKYPLKEGIPEAGFLQQSDLVNSAKRGATIGGTVGMFAGLTAVALTPMGLIAAGGAVLGASMAGATAGTWTSTMIGVSVPNSDLSEFQDAIDEGQIMMLVDVEDDLAEFIKKQVLSTYPEAVIQSGVIESDALTLN